MFCSLTPLHDDRALLLLPYRCAGVSSPDLIGQLVEVLPHLPVDVDFPYPCSSGLLGSSDGSTTALCDGLVPAQSEFKPLLHCTPIGC